MTSWSGEQNLVPKEGLVQLGGWRVSAFCRAWLELSRIRCENSPVLRSVTVQVSHPAPSAAQDLVPCLCGRWPLYGLHGNPAMNTSASSGGLQDLRRAHWAGLLVKTASVMSCTRLKWQILSGKLLSKKALAEGFGSEVKTSSKSIVFSSCQS